MIIKPSTALRNDYNAISKLAHEAQEPIYITKNGEGDLVVMSIDAFERWGEAVRLKSCLDTIDRARQGGQQGYTLEESRQRLEEVIRGKTESKAKHSA